MISILPFLTINQSVSLNWGDLGVFWFDSTPIISSEESEHQQKAFFWCKKYVS